MSRSARDDTARGHRPVESAESEAVLKQMLKRMVGRSRSCILRSASAPVIGASTG